MSDYRRKHEHPDGALLSVSLFQALDTIEVCSFFLDANRATR